MHSTMYGGGDNNMSDGIKSQVTKLLQQKEMEDEKEKQRGERWSQTMKKSERLSRHSRLF